MAIVTRITVAEMSLTPKAPLLREVANVLQRARKLPCGPVGNNLRQLARGLLKLHRSGFRANVEIVERHAFSGSLRPDAPTDMA
jgi:hypothetical protein